MSSPRRRLVLVLALAGALTAATAHRVCDLVFGCGCTWIVSGATAHCNIHAPHPPHCPACRGLAPASLLGVGVFAAWAGLLEAVTRAFVRPDP